MVPGIMNIFSQHESAMNAGDSLGVAVCYADRFLHVTRSGKGWKHDWRRNDREFRVGLKLAHLFYRSLGACTFETVRIEESWLRPSHSLARVEWSVRRADKTELVAF